MSEPVQGVTDRVAAVDLRSAMGHYPTGVVIVTTFDREGRPVGFTCNSFCSVSLNPPLVSFCLRTESRLLENFTQSTGFNVNLLSRDQKALSARFASRQVKDKFDGVEWTKGSLGFPKLSGALVTFECIRHRCVEAGDHYLFLGEVTELTDAEQQHRGALMFYRGAYTSIEAATN